MKTLLYITWLKWFMGLPDKDSLIHAVKTAGGNTLVDAAMLKADAADEYLQDDLRDMFAANAMQAIFPLYHKRLAGGDATQGEVANTYRLMAIRSYEIANAMLEERKKHV